MPTLTHSHLILLKCRAELLFSPSDTGLCVIAAGWYSVCYRWDVHKFPLCCCFLPHCFMTCSSAVMNVFVCGVCGDTHTLFLYTWQILLKGYTLNILCMHIIFTSGSQNWLKGCQPADWRWMSHSARTCRMDDSLFWAHSSVLILSLSYSSFWFPFFTFYLSFLPQFCFSSLFPFVFLPFNYHRLNDRLLVCTVFCCNYNFHSIHSHIFLVRTN